MATALKDRLAKQASGETQLSFDPTGRDEPRLVLLPLRSIDPDPNQPRKDLGDLNDLADSIREHGVVQPIIVEPVEGGRHRILAGERRYAACHTLAMEFIPCIVRTAASQSRMALQLVENLHRKDLHPIEEAQAFKRLMDEFGLSQRDLGLRLGKSLTSINETLRILQINAGIIENVRTSEHCTKSVLLEIAKETDPQQQQALWNEMEAGQLTVRQARKQKAGNSGTKSRKATFKLELPEATVVIKFSSGESSHQRVREALQAALNLQTDPL